LTVDGQRTVLTAKPAGPTTGARTTAPATRTPAEVEALITKTGATPPEWFESTKLNFPKSLDLSWADPPKGQWNNQLNVGQFVWDIINPNENRWREGIKLMDHVLTLNNSDPAIRLRSTKEIGHMYFRFFQDYARAAWWWHKAGVDEDDPQSVSLAECYWRLGSKKMALDSIDAGFISTIKLLGDMGETDKAVRLADRFTKSLQSREALVLAGDACRLAGRQAEALAHYQKVLQLPVGPNDGDRFERVIGRAQASLDAIKLFELSNVTKVADGTYRSTALAYEGDLEVTVEVKAKRIESVKVTKHKEKQYYSAMRDVPAQIIAKQGVKGVDATSRATITGNAIINATAKALAEGAK
jgi:uncharacterized protein with FMN-binding domain